MVDPSTTGRSGGPHRARSNGRGPVLAVVVIGLGLALAPAVFQMFTRAPEGGRMIEQFRPYMTPAKLDRFRGFLAEIGAADAELRRTLPALAPALGVPPTAVEVRFPAVAELHRRWPTIDQDMGDMLATMRENLDRFRGVSALPPFVLFPWFFVIPGVLAAGLGLSILVRGGGGSGGHTGGAHRRLRALVALGIGLVAAPAVFQMFERAPGGARMIEEFRPLMTTAKVTTVQGYFLVLGAAEGQLRTEVLPALSAAAAGSLPAPPPPAELPAVAAFIEDWPRISNEMAPMIGTMADNVDNFAAVDALPPFSLFPWFFVAPGLAVAGLALAAIRPAWRPGRRDDPSVASAVVAGPELAGPELAGPELADRSRAWR